MDIRSKRTVYVKIYDSKNIMELKELPVLEDGSCFIYVMQNYPQNNIKIGKSTNMVQRLQSLSGSNSGGNKIVKIGVISEPTFVQSAEKTFHSIFDRYRIPDTEWFEGITFEDVVAEIEKQFNMSTYERCNKLRKEQAEIKLCEDKQKLEDELKQEESKKKKKSSKK